MSIFNYREGMRAGDRIVLNVDGVEYAFRWCPAGSFTMGGRGWRAWLDSARQHDVRLTRGFWILETQVTQKMWKSVMGTDPSYFKGALNPVESVSWDDCQDFCKKLSEKLGVTVTLPTEAQWEYACRAGTTTEYAGNSLDEMGWYVGNTCSLYNRISEFMNQESLRPGSDGSTHPVGQKRPNAWGLYDMHGNVLEWCLDRDGDEPVTTDGNDLFIQMACRGGSWCLDAANCRSWSRHHARRSIESCEIGFRFLLIK